MKYLKYVFFYFISFFLRYFYRTDPNLLLFGSRGGTAYDDNSKYLFIYGNTYTSFNCIWLSKDIELVRKIRNQGYQAEYCFSWTALRLGLKANAIFITHSLSDVLPVFYNRQTKVINLHHGIPIKKIEFLDKNIPLRGRIMNYWKSKKTTYMISNSEYYMDVYKKCFKISYKKIINIGYPRMEFLINPGKFNINLVSPFKEGINFLYLPTFRDFSANDILDKQTLYKINEIMKEKGGNFYIKLHPFEKRKLCTSNYSNIHLIPNNKNVQEVLPFADVLITDYSSAVFDFMVFRRPVIFFCADIKKYKESRGFIINFEKIFKDQIAYNTSEFLNKLNNYNLYIVPKEVEKKIFNNKFEQSCELIFELL
ncbi:CDP-glycerol glycerophosphotransferase family protein [Weizmannia agrestimuris]|uniref:CDP-glycerol glycerophosphotransferase family protein n=1 Tax=Weizmannia agrestimuris TaxID=2941342 RepID=UPI00203F71FC|nr:CDP-glycerol glycerophosphotransferase family protein [Weizmannia agrestimuris]